MKKLLSFLFVLFALISCGESPEKKAEALIADATKKTLFIPESYEQVDMKLDSAFLPYDSPMLYDKVYDFSKRYFELQEYEDKAKYAKSSMANWQGLHMSAYAENEYQESKKEYEEYVKKIDMIKKQLAILVTDVKELLNRPRQFVGFKAVHRFRASTNAGQTVFGNYLYFFDKDLKEVVALYDVDSEDFVRVQKMAEDFAIGAEEFSIE